MIISSRIGYKAEQDQGDILGVLLNKSTSLANQEQRGVSVNLNAVGYLCRHVHGHCCHQRIPYSGRSLSEENWNAC